jgi:hypothetical protein
VNLFQLKAAADLLARHPRIWILVAVIGLWFAITTARRMFDGWSGFLEAMRYKFQPGWLSLMRGEFWEDAKAEFKLLIWFLMTLLVMLGMKISLTKLVVMYSLAEKLRLPI